MSLFLTSWKKRKSFIPFISFNCHFSILRHLMLNSFVSRVGSVLWKCHFSSKALEICVKRWWRYSQKEQSMNWKDRNNGRGWLNNKRSCLNNKQWRRSKLVKASTICVNLCSIFFMDLQEQKAFKPFGRHFADVFLKTVVPPFKTNFRLEYRKKLKTEN